MQRDVKIGLVLGVAILAVIIIAVMMQDDTEVAGPRVGVINAVPSNFDGFPDFNDTPVPPPISTTPPATSAGGTNVAGPPAPTVGADTIPTPPATAGTVVGGTAAPVADTLVAPETRVHVVAKGDTIWDLGVKYYGDGLKGKLILQANKAVIPNAGMLRVGQKLIIPPADSSAAPAARVAPVAPVAPVTNVVAGTKHTLTKKDTLWSLAQKYYGDGNKWKRILQANQDIIKDERHLPVGKTIVIPRAD